MLKIMLFTTEHCVGCKPAREFLMGLEAPVSVELVDAARRPELAQRYGVRQSPTILIFNNDGIVWGKSGFSRDIAKEITDIIREEGKRDGNG